MSRRFAIVASDAEPAQAALAELTALYPTVAPEEAEIVVALGGDGFMLQTLHRFIDRDLPIYGMHRGSVGFLMNPYRPAHLTERLDRAETATLYPLAMRAITSNGETIAVAALRAFGDSPL